MKVQIAAQKEEIKIEQVIDQVRELHQQGKNDMQINRMLKMVPRQTRLQVIAQEFHTSVERLTEDLRSFCCWE